MGQTKRKRRNKHRGNAVGVVEARGRARQARPRAAPAKGAPPRAAARPLKPPTLKGSALKALIGAVILFIFFRFLGNGSSNAQAATMCAVAVVLYTPIMYVTDKWIYN